MFVSCYAPSVPTGNTNAIIEPTEQEQFSELKGSSENIDIQPIDTDSDTEIVPYITQCIRVTCQVGHSPCPKCVSNTTSTECCNNYCGDAGCSIHYIPIKDLTYCSASPPCAY